MEVDGGEKQQRDFFKCAGEVNFECYCQPEEQLGHVQSNGSLRSIFQKRKWHSLSCAGAG